MTKGSAAVPLAVATGLAALMLWLARGPFGAPAPAGTVALGALTLLEPEGELARFPRRFAWEPLPGADGYEITVANEGERRTLFRQRGATPVLTVAVEAAAEPPPGPYVWEVLALRHSLPVARGVGRFTVRPDPAPSP